MCNAHRYDVARAGLALACMVALVALLAACEKDSGTRASASDKTSEKTSEPAPEHPPGKARRVRFGKLQPPEVGETWTHIATSDFSTRLRSPVAGSPASHHSTFRLHTEVRRTILALAGDEISRFELTIVTFQNTRTENGTDRSESCASCLDTRFLIERSADSVAVTRADGGAVTAEERAFIVNYFARSQETQPIVRLLPDEVEMGAAHELSAAQLAEAFGQGAPFEPIAGSLVVHPGSAPDVVEVVADLRVREPIYEGRGRFALTMRGTMTVELATRNSRAAHIEVTGTASGDDGVDPIEGEKRMVMQFSACRGACTPEP